MFNLVRHWLVILVLSAIWGFLVRPDQHNLSLLVNTNTFSSRPAHVLLLTAHPDDECMFFAPTILALLDGSSHPPPTLYSLCLSVGNADGIGDIRRHELARSLEVLGIEEGRRWVIDTPELQDNFTAQWDAQIIANIVRSYVLENNITTILTFDHHGISSHPNHISLPKGASHLLSTITADTGQQNPPRLFTLITVPLHEKYLGVLSPLLSKASASLTEFLRGTNLNLNARDRPSERAVAVSGLAGYARAHRAMREHWSQLVWFRWLYVSFSRYMWVNEWVELTPLSNAQTANSAQP